MDSHACLGSPQVLQLTGTDLRQIQSLQRLMTAPSKRSDVASGSGRYCKALMLHFMILQLFVCFWLIIPSVPVWHVLTIPSGSY